MLDVMSMSQFLLMTSDLLGVVAKAGGDMKFDWMRYVSRGLNREMVRKPRWSGHALTVRRAGSHPWRPQKHGHRRCGITKQTLYEVSRDQFTRATYDRAVESLDSVNAEITGLIASSWGRS